MTVIKYGNVVHGARSAPASASALGINVGYLKFTKEPTWNPF